MFAILVGISLKSAAVLAAARLMAWLLRGRSAAGRHLVWTATAAAILALPLLSAALPSWRLPVPGTFAPANVGLVFRVFVTAHDDAAAARPVAPHEFWGTKAPTGRQMPGKADWRLWVTALWALGAAVALLRMLAAYLWMNHRRVRSRLWDDRGEFRALAKSLGIQGRVDLLKAAPGTMPMAVGVLKPAVFLPADAADWSAERRRVVLLHELAHVRRGDVAAHMMVRAALSLNWWNPLAWLAWRESLKECERAADDLVLAAGTRPSEYAGHLLEVARSMQSPAGTAWAALAMARRAEMEGRLLAILDPHTRRHAGGRGTPAAALAALGAVLLVAPFAAVRAQDQSSAVPPELDPTIRIANSQKNHEILEHAASAYENLQRYDVAQTLLEKALAIRGQVSGEQSAAYAAGLVKLGDLELRRNRKEEALSFYNKAVSLGDRPEVAGALIQLGIAAMSREGSMRQWVRVNLGIADDDSSAARDYLQRAVNVDPTGPKAGVAYTWMAELRRAEPGGTNEAESLYQKALAVEEPNSAEAANTMHLYARFLEQHDRAGEGDVMEKQARAITQATATEFARKMQNAAGTVVRFRAETVLGPNGYERPAAGQTAGAAPVPDSALPASTAARVGNGVSAPVLLYKTEPEYTEEARLAKYQGTVLVYVEIGPDGKAHNMKVVRGLGLGLDEKAIEAVAKWKFKPGQKEGQPVTVQATIEVNFRLL